MSPVEDTNIDSGAPEWTILWTVLNGIQFAQALEVELGNVGWHVALGGSVLHAGYSFKDIDLIVFPHQRTTAKPSFKMLRAMRAILVALGWRSHVTVRELHKFWRAKGLKDQKHVEVWHTPDGRRVDLLVLS